MTGFCNLNDGLGSWIGDSPQDADTASIPIFPGDVVILATDGLFDNVDLEEIVDEVADWEKEWFDTSRSDYYLYPADDGTNDAAHALSKRLVEKAREYSLDTERDSPFAALAKVFIIFGFYVYLPCVDCFCFCLFATCVKILNFHNLLLSRYVV